MAVRKAIALVAHDKKKAELLDWVNASKDRLAGHVLYATGTTGKLVSLALEREVICLLSGPLGGDQELGALIAEQKIDIVFFFWDPLESQPHDPDVKALLRICMVWNVPVACNRASADFFVTSPSFSQKYDRLIPNYESHNARFDSHT